MRHLLLALGLAMAMQSDPAWETQRTDALKLLLDERHSEAVGVLEEAVSRWPMLADAHHELGGAIEQMVLGAQIKGTPLADRTTQLERAVKAYRRAAALNAEYRPLVLMKLMSVYDADGLNQPREVEAAARALVKLDPSSAIYPVKLARALAAQERCGEGARVLVEADRTVTPDARDLLGASVLDYVMNCDGLTPADLRPLLALAESTAEAEVKRAPDDRDAVMRQAAVYTALASKLPDGPEKKAAEARSNALFDRFMEMNPDRKRAMQGEPPDDLYAAFSYLGEFESKGLHAEAQRLLANLEKANASSPEFWEKAASHHRFSGKLAAAISATERWAALVPKNPDPRVFLGSLHLEAAEKEDATAAQRSTAFTAAHAEIDRALAMDASSRFATEAKAHIFTTQAASERDASRKRALEQQAAEWQRKAERLPRTR